MSTLPERNPRLPENINRSESHPLKEFFSLLLSVLLGLVLLATLIGLLSQWLAPFIPFAWEETAARALDGLMAQEFSEAEITAEQQRRLQALGSKLVQADSPGIESGLAVPGGEIPDQAFVFRLVHSDVANAFASLGARIYVTDELLSGVTSENALAMVLAHEIAHIRYRHPLRSSSGALVLNVIMSAVLGYQGTSVLREILAGSGFVTISGFSRDMEVDADARGLAILVQAYGHSYGADEFFRNVAGDEEGPRWLEFSRTHPNTRSRLEAIKASIRSTVPDLRHPPGLLPLPPELRYDEPTE